MGIISNHFPLGAAPQMFRERLKDISMFFDATDRIHQTMRRVVAKLEQAGIQYALVGGMAVVTRIHPTVRGDFIECLEEKRREDEYEAREDKAFEQTFKPDVPPESE